MAGALPVAELFRLARRAGLIGARVIERFDCFGGTSIEGLARRLEIEGVTFRALKRRRAPLPRR